MDERIKGIIEELIAEAEADPESDAPEQLMEHVRMCRYTGDSDEPLVWVAKDVAYAAMSKRPETTGDFYAPEEDFVFDEEEDPPDPPIRRRCRRRR